MAEVYRAYHPNLDRYVAIKVLHAFLAEDPEFRERFEKEARNIAKLNHPHIVQVYDFDYAAERDSYYMVMELIPGETLKDRLYMLAEQGEKITLSETLRIIREAATALAYAHNRGMIHRDVKPANLMLDTSNRVVLTDFGIAKMLDSKQMTVSGGMIGTPAYMSPEQGLGEPGDERSDLYSLGVIMYQLLVGELPFDAETALGVILMHVNDPIPEVRTFDPSIPKEVQQIVYKVMAKDPAKRYQKAEEMIADIEAHQLKMAAGAETMLAKPASKTLLVPPSRTLSGSPTNSPVPYSVGKTGPLGAAAAQEKRILESQRIQSVKDQLHNVDRRTTKQQGNNAWLVWVALIVLLALGGGYYAGVQAAIFPAFWVPQATSVAVSGLTPSVPPTLTANIPTQTPTLGRTSVIAQVLTPNGTDPLAVIPSETSILLPSATPTATENLSSPTPSNTPTPSMTPTPSPNPTLTAAVAQTATITACRFDYTIMEQVPPDGEDGGFFRVNQPYQRQITLLNTGTCEWGANTSLTFASGEDFNAGPRIFIRESLQIGQEAVLVFDGMTPARGNIDPLVGAWQLRTRGQIPIGEPFNISVSVFDPGT
jgi:serine/threonine-protein kinase